MALAPSVTAFAVRLGSAVTEDSFGEYASSLQTLLRHGDGAEGFLDDSLPSILQRCKRIERNGAAVAFLIIIHHLQLLCKCTRYVVCNRMTAMCPLRIVSVFAALTR